MNSQTLKNVAMYAGGAVVGGLIGAVIGSLIVDQILASENGPVFQEEGEEAAEEGSDPDSSPHLLKKVPKQQTVKLDYTKFSKIEDGKDNLSDLVQKYAGKDESVESVDMSSPYVISVEDYNETGENNIKVTLTYYEIDDVLTQQDDSVIREVEKMIGSDALLKFGINSDDDDVVFVRNGKLGTDFEVIRVRKSYSETVLGIREDEGRPGKKVKKQDEDDE